MKRVLATTARVATQVSPRAVTTTRRPLQAATTPSRRPFSSTPSTRFFFRRPTVEPTQVIKDITSAAQDGRPDIVSKLYPSLVEIFSTTPQDPHSPLVPHHRFQQLMRSIAQTNRTNLLLRMFKDLTTKFGFTPTPLDHHILILGLSNGGKLFAAMKWIQHMSDSGGGGPHVSDFNVVLNAWRKRRNLYEMRKVVERMKQFKVEPNVVTYNTFINALFEHERVDEVRKLRDEMEEKGIEPDSFTETAMLTGFIDVGEMASAKRVQQRLAPIVEEAVESGMVDSKKYDTAMVNALLKFESVANGFDEAVTLAERYRDGGVPLDLWTLNSLLQQGSKEIATAEEGVRLIERLEDAVEVEADRRAWSIVIAGLCKSRRPGGLDQALELYRIARDRSVEPDTTMIHPLIEALFSPSPTPETFATAKTLYEDLSTFSRTYDQTPGYPVYALLLRACADPATLDLEYSRQLVADMKKGGIQLEPEAAMSHMQSLMLASSSFEEAFQAYDELRALDPSVLADTKSYNTILSTFFSLRLPSTSSQPPPIAPQSLVMEFLSDMRRSNHPADAITYSTILTYYSRDPTILTYHSRAGGGKGGGGNSNHSALSTIEHFHSLLKLDVHVDPDTALFNSLMSAYSRLGAWSQAYRVWDTIVANNRAGRGGGGGVGPDQRSLSILIDTVGHDGSKEAKQRGRSIWNEFERGRRVGGISVRNRKNWDSWIECLCRWKEYDEAIEVVFERMEGGKGVPRGDRVTLETLTKFARRSGRRHFEEVRDRIKSQRPELYDVLMNEGDRPLRDYEERR